MNRSQAITRLSVAGLLATSLAFAAPAARAAEGLSVALTPAQVQCEQIKLRGLLYLSSAPYSDPATLLASPGTGESVSLLAVKNQWGQYFERVPLDPKRVPEVQLAATLVPGASTLLLNPERPRLVQVGLVRNDPATTLRALHPETEALELDVQAADSLDRQTMLILDNGSLSGTTRPGRALPTVGAVQECDLPLTDEDRLVFTVLQRLVRPRFQALFPYDSNTDDAWVAIYRAEAPDTFWIDVYESSEVLSPTPDPAALDIFFVPNRLRLTVARDGQGRLTTGTLELVQEQTPDSLVDLFLAPPTFPGVDVWSEDEPPTVHLSYPEAFASGPVQIDLGALLDGTTWNPPRL